MKIQQWAANLKHFARATDREQGRLRAAGGYTLLPVRQRAWCGLATDASLIVSAHHSRPVLARATAALYQGDRWMVERRRLTGSARFSPACQTVESKRPPCCSSRPGARESMTKRLMGIAGSRRPSPLEPPSRKADTLGTSIAEGRSRHVRAARALHDQRWESSA